jgi:alpha-galactosidase
MIPFGHIGIRCTIAGKDRRTRFTRDEQVTLMSLWSLASSPLMLGMHLPDNDEFAESLITNDEVLAINQDSRCAGARRVSAADGLEVWTKELANGSRAVGFFNRSGAAATVTLAWKDAGLSGKQSARDLWQRKDLGEFADSMSQPVQAHGAVLLVLKRSDH